MPSELRPRYHFVALGTLLLALVAASARHFVSKQLLVRNHSRGGPVRASAVFFISTFNLELLQHLGYVSLKAGEGRCRFKTLRAGIYVVEGPRSAVCAENLLASRALDAIFDESRA